MWKECLQVLSEVWFHLYVPLLECFSYLDTSHFTIAQEEFLNQIRYRNSRFKVSASHRWRDFRNRDFLNVSEFRKVRNVDTREISNPVNMTTSTMMLSPTTETTSLAMQENESDYPFWHVIFWVSPHFQAFVVSASIILFALPVSYITGIISFISDW